MAGADRAGTQGLGAAAHVRHRMWQGEPSQRRHPLPWGISWLQPWQRSLVLLITWRGRHAAPQTGQDPLGRGGPLGAVEFSHAVRPASAAAAAVAAATAAAAAGAGSDVAISAASACACPVAAATAAAAGDGPETARGAGVKVGASGFQQKEVAVSGGAVAAGVRLAGSDGVASAQVRQRSGSTLVC